MCCLPFLVRVGSDEVEVELVDVDFGEEFSPASKVFQVEELVFFEAMNGFDVALVSVCGGRDAHVLAVTESLGKVAFKLAAVVGLPDEVAQRDSVAMQMLLNTNSEDRAGRGAAFFGEGPEQQSAANIAGGVLNGGQAEMLSLWPVAGDIVEILGIGADLLEERPSGFNVREILLALIFFLSGFEQTVFPPDPLHGHVAKREVELALEPGGTEGGQFLAESQNLLFDLDGRFQRMTMWSAALFLQSRGAKLLVAPPPFADGPCVSGKEQCGRFDASFTDGLHQTKAMVVGVFHLTHQIEVTGGSSHGATILVAAGRPALPPAGRPAPFASSDSYISTPLGGNDVPFQFHAIAFVDTLQRVRYAF